MKGEQRQYEALDAEQLRRLIAVLTSPINVESQGHLPVLSFTPARFIFLLRKKIVARGIEVSDVRLEGSGAAHCLSQNAMPFNDLDVVFHLESIRREDLICMRGLVLECMSSFLPEGMRHLDEYSLSSYLSKMFITPTTTNDGDSWALMTLRAGPSSTPLDLKFVQRMSRPFQFSMDSFQIFLDERDLAPVLEDSLAAAAQGIPLVLVQSTFGNVQTAMQHLDGRLIVVHEPRDLASIHGGGLLKYCLLLTKGYTCDPALDQPRMMLYMCNRFFVDFPQYETTRHGAPVQTQRLEDFMDAHVPRQPVSVRAAFLTSLLGVLASSGGRQAEPLMGYIYATNHTLEVLRPPARPAFHYSSIGIQGRSRRGESKRRKGSLEVRSGSEVAGEADEACSVSSASSSGDAPRSSVLTETTNLAPYPARVASDPALLRSLHHLLHTRCEEAFPHLSAARDPPRPYGKRLQTVSMPVSPTSRRSTNISPEC